MWQHIKNMIYDLLVWSGILHYIFPYLFPLLQRFMLNPEKMSNHQATDDKGRKLRLTRYNGRNYPAVDVSILQSIPNTKIRKDDVFLCSYPKAGCHWMHEIMHMLVNGRTNLTKMGKEFAGGVDLIPRILLDSLPSPRVLNSHLLYRELPKAVKANKVKIVWMVRNPKDTVVSFFNHHKSLKQFYGYDGEFYSYFKLFMDGELEYGDYFDYMLDWDKVMKSQADNPVLLISYEDMKAQPLETVEKVAKFLDLNISSKFAEEVIDACSFNKLKAVRVKDSDISGKMYRKGTVGDWRNWLTDAQSKAIDQVWREKMLGCSYQPKYDLE